MYLSRLLLLFAVWAWSAAVERRVNEMQRNRFWDVASDVKGWGISSWSFSVTLVCDSWIYRSSFSFFKKHGYSPLDFCVLKWSWFSIKPLFPRLHCCQIIAFCDTSTSTTSSRKRQQLFSMMPVFSLLRVTRCFHIWISWSQLHVCLLDTFSYLPESYYYSHSLLQVQEKKKKRKMRESSGVF